MTLAGRSKKYDELLADQFEQAWNCRAIVHNRSYFHPALTCTRCWFPILLRVARSELKDDARVRVRLCLSNWFTKSLLLFPVACLFFQPV